MSTEQARADYAQMKACQALWREGIALIRRGRKRTREAEEMAPREAAEGLAALARTFERALEMHLAGDNDGATAVTPEGVADDDTDDASES